ncbi:hypothetical protein OAI28_00430 [Methylophilaceae bacterium]|nr:hypothetical protein [Methylophilaceae bacterium]
MSLKSQLDLLIKPGACDVDVLYLAISTYREMQLPSKKILMEK